MPCRIIVAAIDDDQGGSFVKTIRRFIVSIIGFSTLAAVIAGIFQMFEKKTNDHKPFGVYERFIKRPLDVFLSTGALIVLCPVYIITAISVRKKLGSPILFKQHRPGRDGKIFTLYKFRTMMDDRDENGVLLPDSERLTPFGNALRSTSLDELPELINIIRGDCAICGPRPLLVRYLDRYNEEQRHRHDVRPGLTGYAQAHGRNGLTWEDRFAMDVWYTKNITFLTDVRIIIDTLRIVRKREGINSETAATMEEFMGTPDGVKSTWRAPD